MLGFLGGLSVIQKYIMGGLVSALLVVGGTFAIYYNISQSNIAALNQNIATKEADIAKLKENIKLQNASIKFLEKKRGEDQKNMDVLASKHREAVEEREVLKKKLRRGRLRNLTRSKPKMIQKIINKGTDKVFAEFEELTNPDTFVKEVPEPKDEKPKDEGDKK